MKDLHNITSDTKKMIEIVNTSTKRSYLEFYPEGNKDVGLVKSGSVPNMDKVTLKDSSNLKTDVNNPLDMSDILSGINMKAY